MLRTLRAILLASAAALAAAGAARAEELEVVKGGKYWGTVETYQVGPNTYLGLKEAAKVYGAQLYWYAVKGQVTLTLRGRPIMFTEDSDEVNVAGRKTTLPRPLLVRAGRAFVPVEFFADPAFAEAAGFETKFNPSTRLLLVDQRSNVGPMRWFTYPDHTRIVLELSEGLRYEANRREVGGYELAIVNGVIDWSERVDVGDGVVDSVHLTQDARQAVLSVGFLEGADGVKLMELPSPRRLVLDVARRPGAPRAARPAGASLPEKVAAKAPIKPAAPGASVIEEKPPVPKAGVRSKARYRIAVDAGHGGKDGGAVGRRGTLEKEINLSAALELVKLLEQEERFEVILVRPDDTFVKLGDRSKKANAASADLFLSLHSNSHPSRLESGFEVYFLSERASDPEAERLAEFENSVLEYEGAAEEGDEASSILVQMARNEFLNDAGELAGLVAKNLATRVDLANRGVKQAAFYVLRGASAPSILVEMGFLSNERDEAKLQSAKYRRRLVEGIYAGVVEFYNRRAAGSGGGR
ncbi:MAG: N-acetylmuramoyl-L-alanine amidase [Elusimicrobia bacterium]|nr:N-acetylmuramoyl-L-alanine amidase [Elusimicrobiota bacterium]